MIGSRVSKRYAKALLSLGQEDGKFEEYGRNLHEFVEICDSNREFFRVVSNPIFPVEERKKVLDFALEKSNFSVLVQNFLRLLLEKNRMGAIYAITDYYSKLTDELSNITRADVITARPLGDEAVQRLRKALTELTSKDVKMTVEQDASLIGGLVVKIGDLVLDGSVRAQLSGLKESLKRGE